MKYILLFLIALSNIHANANEITIHSTSIYMIIFFLILLLIITAAYFIHKCDKKEKQIKVQKDKIYQFEQDKIAQDKAKMEKKQAVEKEIIQLNHTISDLERQMKEGTKNQIVSQIESLRQKRQSN